eukprot:9504140-Pyramimonas_sp.AAC.1
MVACGALAGAQGGAGDDQREGAAASGGGALPGGPRGGAGLPHEQAVRDPPGGNGPPRAHPPRDHHPRHRQVSIGGSTVGSRGPFKDPFSWRTPPEYLSRNFPFSFFLST